MTVTRWTPGDVPVAVSGRVMLAIDEDVELLERLWLEVEAGATVAQLLRELVMAYDGSVLSLPDFMFVLGGPDRGKAVARGRFRLLDDAGTLLLHAPDPVAWQELSLEATGGLVLELGQVPRGSLSLAVRSGIVPASRVELEDSVPDGPPLEAGRHAQAVSVPSPPEPDQGEPQRPKDALALPEVISQAQTPPSQEPGPEPEPEPAPEPAPASGPDAEEQTGAISNATLGPEHIDLIGSDTSAQPEPGPLAAQSAYAHHYGDHTVVGSVADAAIQASEDEPAPLVTAVPGASPSSPQPPAPSRPGSQQPLLVDQVPSAPANAAEPAEPAEPAEEYDWQHDGHTVVGAQLRSGLPAPQDTGQAGVGEVPEGSVLAVMCPNHHPNAVVAVSCRVCAAPVSGPSVRVPRPVLGRLRTTSGEQVDLDQDVVIGRAPLATPQPGGTMPHLLVVACPDKSVSKTHCAVRVQEWDLLVEDLGSTNGTYLLRQGQAPRPVTRGVPQPLQVGDALDLADSVRIIVEALDG